MGPVAPDRGEDRRQSARHRLGAPGGPVGGLGARVGFGSTGGMKWDEKPGVTSGGDGGERGVRLGTGLGLWGWE